MSQRARGLLTTGLTAIAPEPVRWLIPEYWPLGKMVLVAGDAGQGKSAVTLDVAACLTTGRACLGLDYQPPPPAEVLLVSCEDDFHDTVVPRLLSAGADLKRIRRVDGRRGPRGSTRPFSLAHLRQIDEELAARPKVRLVVVDPAGAYLTNAGANALKDAGLRGLLDPLTALAARRQVTLVIVKHLNKGTSSKSIHKVSGSAGYLTAVRAAFVIAPDLESPEQRLFVPLKFNLGPRPKALAFRLVPLTDEEVPKKFKQLGRLPAKDRMHLRAQLFRLTWQGSVNIEADRALAGPSKDETRKKRKLIEEAAKWLETWLFFGPRSANDCAEMGNHACSIGRDVAWWREVILKGELHGSSLKTGFGDTGRLGILLADANHDRAGRQ